jgi:NAD(P)-dependent dehydrogenase (short-subunit alcohol dehydrogenase family)
MFGFGNKFNPDTDIPDLTGKIILVTGGNSGLGKESVRQFAKHNAKVYMGARSEQKATAAITELQNENPNANIVFLDLDLASLDSVKKAAATFLSQNERLDILMNNGGIMAVPPAISSDGYEIQLGTNHLGHAALTRLLMPVLLKTASESDVRIINLTSVGQELFAPKCGLLLDDAKTDMAAIGAWGLYGQSKLANIYFTKGLAEHYPQIKSVAIHPGNVKGTALSDTARANFSAPVKVVARIIEGVASPFFPGACEGVYNQVWASTAKTEEVISGAVYYPIAQEHKGRALMNDPKMVDWLWDWTEKELISHGL